MNGTIFARRHDLDFIRVAAFGLVIVFHTALVFGTRPWLINAPSSSPIVDMVLLAMHPWRLSLLFLISGVATAALASRLPPSEIRALRTRQLLPPVLFGVFVLIPPQIFVAVRDGLGIQISYVDFWLAYLRFGSIAGPDGATAALVSFQHLWFLAYLWLYAGALTLCLQFATAFPRSLTPALAARLQGRDLLIRPVVYLSVLRVGLYPIFGETLVPQTDIYYHIVNFSFFLFGFVMADDEAFWANVVERRYEALLCVLLSLLTMLSLYLLYPPDSRGVIATALFRVERSVLQWCAIVAILGFCKGLITMPHPVVTYLNKAVMTYFVLHQTLIILIAFWLKNSYGLGGSAFLVIVVGCMAGCGLIYEAKRRVGVVLGRHGRRQPRTS